TARFTVIAPTTMTVTVSFDSSSVAVGGTAHATATVRDWLRNVHRGTIVLWNSSDNNTATIGGSGVVHAIAPGTATISATYLTYSGSAPFTVRSASSVQAPVVATVGVTIDSTSLTVGNSAHA